MSSSTSSTPSEKKKLSEKHINYLRARAVPPEFAIEAGLRSMPAMGPAEIKKLKAHFRGLPLPPVPGLFVPHRVEALDGIRRARIRPDADHYFKENSTQGGPEIEVAVPRWLAQKDVPVVPYYPPQLVKFFKDPTVAMHIVEAPIKALALTANGFAAIGLGGVEAGYHDAEQWKTHKSLAINKELARVDWRKRTAFIVYDAGITNNPRVAIGSAKLAVVLKDAGAMVRLALLPLVVANDMSIDEALTYEGRDQGPDDFLGRHGENGPQRLREIVDAAVPADPIARARTAMAAANKDDQRKAVVDLLADLTFVSALDVGGRVVVDQVVAIVAKCGIKARSIQEAVKKLHERSADSSKADPADGLDMPYVVEDGRIAMSGFKTDVRYLADFNAEIVQEIVKDDGISKARVYRIDGTLPDGLKLPSVDIPADEFPEMKWTTAWGSKAIVRAGRDTRDHLRVAIQAMSKPTTRNVYAHIGWRQIGGKMVYMHPRGAIGGEGVAVEVDVDLGGGRFCLPDRVDDLVAAIRCSLAVLDVGPLAITLPILAAAYTSILSSALAPDFGLWLVGKSGALKSTLAALVESHFGSYEFNSLPVGWSSTFAYIEGQLFRWKDALITIDNYVPGQTAREHQDLQNKALRIIQNIGDRSSRGRNDRNNDARVRRDPRGLIVCTGEDLPPTNESTLGRLLVLDVGKGALDLDKIIDIRNSVEMLAQAMRGFIEFLATDFEATTTKAKNTRSLLAAQLRRDLRPFGAHERTANNLATLAAGFVTFLDFAYEAGVLIEVDVETWKLRMMEIFLDVGKAQRVNSEGSKPTERYMLILKSLLLQGRVTLAPKDDTLDTNTSAITRAIGWIDHEGGEVLLMPELAWEAVELFVGRDRWPYKQVQLQKQLAEEGIIKKEESDDNKSRLTCRRTAGKRTVRVLVFNKSTFEEVLLGPRTSNVSDAEIAMALDMSGLN